jgi:hypothetical protein
MALSPIRGEGFPIWDLSPEELRELQRIFSELVRSNYSVTYVSSHNSGYRYTSLPPHSLLGAEMQRRNAIAPPSPRPAKLPPEIPAEIKQKMGIINGQRIGYTEKDEFYARLADAYAAGCLTKEHFDERQKYIDDAVTRTQCEAVLTDLQSTGAVAKANELTAKVTETRKPATAGFLPAISLYIVGLGVGIGGGGWVTAGAFFTIATVFAMLAFKAVK